MGIVASARATIPITLVRIVHTCAGVTGTATIAATIAISLDALLGDLSFLCEHNGYLTFVNQGS